MTLLQLLSSMTDPDIFSQDTELTRQLVSSHAANSIKMISPCSIHVSHRSPPNIGPLRKQLIYTVEAAEVAGSTQAKRVTATESIEDRTVYSMLFKTFDQLLNCHWRKNSRTAPILDMPQQDDNIRPMCLPQKHWPLMTMLGVTIVVLILCIGFSNSAADRFPQQFRDIASSQPRTYANRVFVERSRELMGQVVETVDSIETLDSGRGGGTAKKRKKVKMQDKSGYRDQKFRLRSNLEKKKKGSYNISRRSLQFRHRNLKLEDEVYHNRSDFLKNYEAMEKSLKIYVYKDGYKPLVHKAKDTGVYATEGLFLKRMEDPWNQITVEDPSEANMFFLPFSVRQIVDHLQDPHTRSMRALKTFVRNYVQTISSKYPYWNRTHGADHFFLSCHDWAPLSTQDHVQLHRHAMKVLCNADLTANFDVSKDVSIPQTLTAGNQSQLAYGNLGPDDRDFLAFYAGQSHGLVRPVLTKHWTDNDSEMKVYEILPPSIAVNISYVQHMKRSKFCLCPKGFEVNSPRIVEAILSECVPVIISDNFVLPFSDVLDWRKFSITVLENDIPNLKKILTSVSDDEYRLMQRRLRYVRRHFVWLEEPEDTRFDSFHMILYSIWMQSLKIHRLMLRSYH